MTAGVTRWPSYGPQFLGASVITQPFVPVNGAFAVPQGPGWILEVDEAKIEAILAEG